MDVLAAGPPDLAIQVNSLSNLVRPIPPACSGCDGGDRPVYSLQWAAAAGVPTEKDYPYPLPAATGICNPKVTKMKRAYTGGAVEVDLASSQSLFKVCVAICRRL